MSSIDHVHEQETAEAPAEHIAVDGSAGSDTDTGGHLKSDIASKEETEAPHHARSNSVKKPTTFKAVSVTKNFLAKAGTPPVPAAKTNGDNATNSTAAGSTTPQAPKPRLVAKTTSGSQASTPKSSHFARHGGSGPDPMQVWNRNRAAPQPTPKHFTDEELKQQYGIHLATRLQADADGKESKWADIDDDEDDWAPETIEWNDGTKIDLSQNNQAAVLAEEQAKALVEKERQEEERKSKLAAQQKPSTTVGPNATVLKPRSAAQPKTGGVVLKTSTEKPTLVAKPAAPTPVRSPWASLPPVDKVPPVEINPPSQSSIPRPQQNENQGVNPPGSAPLPPAPPAVEIAADDFTRTRKDAQNGNLGQLYNARSGQYEPASAGRRESIRKDGNFRPPSLLQRGSQRDQQVPAEPSTAFQTQRTGNQQDHAPWTRRGSSAVRGDIASQGRRASTSKGSDFSRAPNDILLERRESQPLISPATPSIKDDQIQSASQSPAINHSQINHEAHSATASPYQSRQPAVDGDQSSQRDDVAAQKALMKKKREEAIQRRKAQEEKEEAEKKERIRIKMEKMGMPPLEEKKEKQEPEKKQIEKRVVEGSNSEAKKAEKSGTHKEASPIATEPRVPVQSSPKSTPKPSVPNAILPSPQFDMPKSQAESSGVPRLTSDRLVADEKKTQSPASVMSPSGPEPRGEATERQPAPTVNGITTNQKHPDIPIYKAPDIQNHHVVREPRPQPWNNTQQDQPYGGWNGQALPRESSVSNSVWGTASHSRALGNGTFDRGVQRPQSRLPDQFTPPALAPIGPPRHLQRPRETQESGANNISPVPTVEDIQTIPSFPPVEAPSQSPFRPDLTTRPTSTGKQISSPQTSIGAQIRPQINNLRQPSTEPDRTQASLKAWGSFGTVDAEKNRQLAQQHAAKLAEDARNGIQRPAPQLPVMNETWRQVKLDDQSFQRHIVNVSKAQNTHDRPIGPTINGDIRSPAMIGPNSMPPISAAGIGRGSRFFPGAGAGVQSQYQSAVRFPPGYRRSSSPPPPEDELHYHPAYVREPTRPLVNLPLSKGGLSEESLSAEDKTPKVRLPPAPTTPMQSPILSGVRTIPFRAASQPLVNNPSWQDRFNGLLGVKKVTPESKIVQVADGFSATKVPLDLPVPSSRAIASVSLPPRSDGPLVRELEPVSKPVEVEEALFENREFGSLPAVTIPTRAPEVGWIDAKSLKRGQPKQSKMSKEVEAASRDIFVEKEMIVEGNILVFVNMSGMRPPKSVPMPRSTVLDSARGISRQRNVASGAKSHKAVKTRESSGNSQKANQGMPSNGALQGGSHVQPRGQQTRNRPAWGPRAATAVH
ncbi:hypothetical protein ACLMJK_003386 [Lecanora helva]